MRLPCQGTLRPLLLGRYWRMPKAMQDTSTDFTLRLHYVRPEARTLYEEAGGLCYATACAAGLDLRACLQEEDVCIAAGGRFLVPTGLAVQPVTPKGLRVAGFLYSRSGLGAKQGLTVAQGVGVVDSDYRGEIMVMLLNTSGEEQRLRRGERMAQLLWQPVLRADIEVVHALDDTERGAGGFGHTGKI